MIIYVYALTKNQRSTTIFIAKSWWSKMFLWNLTFFNNCKIYIFGWKLSLIQTYVHNENRELGTMTGRRVCKCKLITVAQIFHGNSSHEERWKEQKERSGKKSRERRAEMNSAMLSRRGPREGSFNTQVEWPVGPQDIGNSISPIATRRTTKEKRG